MSIRHRSGSRIAWLDGLVSALDWKPDIRLGLFHREIGKSACTPSVPELHFTERMFVQLRGEAYNFLNRNNLNNPNTTISSADFGRVLNRSGNRVVQIGVRLVF